MNYQAPPPPGQGVPHPGQNLRSPAYGSQYTSQNAPNVAYGDPIKNQGGFSAGQGLGPQRSQSQRLGRIVFWLAVGVIALQTVFDLTYSFLAAVGFSHISMFGLVRDVLVFIWVIVMLLVLVLGIVAVRAQRQRLLPAIAVGAAVAWLISVVLSWLRIPLYAMLS